MLFDDRKKRRQFIAKVSPLIHGTGIFGTILAASWRAGGGSTRPLSVTPARWSWSQPTLGRVGSLWRPMCATGEHERARTVLQDWLREEPDDPSARHLMAAISGENIPDRASDRYMIALFNGFASSFDHKLARLDYRAPGSHSCCGERRAHARG